MEENFASEGEFFPEILIDALRASLIEKFEAGAMKPAGVGPRFAQQQTAEVRGDKIYWIERESQNEAEKLFLDQIEAFIEYLNRTCYTGINAYEFHYALYEPGSFYLRHRDQFRADHGRKFSVVTYLNEDWGDEDGGQLVMYLGENALSLEPEGGRIVFFKSEEIEHEVLPAQRPRMSITGWLKSV